MPAIPLVAAVNDMSGFGRCSLTVALPVLSAMGMQACPLPTAILSNHTGYESCYFEDFSDRMDAYISQWERLGLRFDGVYTGFLGGCEQVRKIERFLETFAKPGAVRLVDPVMADNGELYATYDAALCEEMKRLVAAGTVTTPNLTEACLLAGEDYGSIAALEGKALLDGVYMLAEKISGLGPPQVVITGIRLGKDTIGNAVLDRRTGERFTAETPLVACTYAGTGDVFASVLCGCLVRGDPLRQAVERTAAFTHRVTAYSYERGLPPMDGIAFEPFLWQLHETAT